MQSRERHQSWHLRENNSEFRANCLFNCCTILKAIQGSLCLLTPNLLYVQDLQSQQLLDSTVCENKNTDSKAQLHRWTVRSEKLQRNNGHTVLIKFLFNRQCQDLLDSLCSLWYDTDSVWKLRRNRIKKRKCYTEWIQRYRKKKNIQ